MQMKADPTRDIWLTAPYQRGGGTFEGRVTRAGARLFFFRHLRDGKQVRFPIGPYDPKGKAGLTLATAAQRAGELSKLYQNGVTDFADYFARQAETQEAEKTAARIERESRPTLRTAVAEWVEVALTPRIGSGHRQGRKDGGKQAVAQFEKWVFPSAAAPGLTTAATQGLADVALAEITRSQFMKCIDAATSANSLRVAEMLLTDLKQFLNFAAEREWVTVNVLATVKRTKPVERERFLSDEELELLWERTRPFDKEQANARKQELGLGNNAPLPPNYAHLSPRFVDAIWITLATGCRVGELLSAAWADVDLDRRSWHLPRTKNQKTHDVPLSEFAIERFQALHRYSAGTSWVFPSKDGGAHIGEKTLGKALRDRMILVKPLKGRSRAAGSLRLKNQKFEGVWTIHDARRTFAVIAGDLGFDPDLIDQAQNHVLQNRIRRTYQRSERTQALAKLFDSVGAHLAQRQRNAGPWSIDTNTQRDSNAPTPVEANSTSAKVRQREKRRQPKTAETLEQEVAVATVETRKLISNANPTNDRQ
jgi:integrase